MAEKPSSGMHAGKSEQSADETGIPRMAEGNKGQSNV